MILVAKPHKEGEYQELDDDGKSQGILYLADVLGVSLVGPNGNAPYENPDGAKVRVAKVPNFLGK